MKPRASIPTTLSIFQARYYLGHAVDGLADELGIAEHRRDVFEDDAGLGKSGTSRMALRSWSMAEEFMASESPTQARDASEDVIPAPSSCRRMDRVL